VTDFDAERTIAGHVAREAGALIRARAGSVDAATIAEKDTHDLVTEVDLAAEALIRERIIASFPSDGFLGEEQVGADGPPERGRLWVVDPLDGTTNFAHGIPPYAVSIALYLDGSAVVAAVYDVPHDELFTAAAGAGATVNGRPTRVSDTSDIDRALIATGFPYRDYRYMEGYMESFEAVARAARGVRRHGSASVDLAWVAAGRFDGFFEAGLAPWDMAAGALLVAEAGGRVDGLPAGADAVWAGAVLASNGLIHEALAGMTEPLGRAWPASRKQAVDGGRETVDSRRGMNRADGLHN